MKSQCVGGSELMSATVIIETQRGVNPSRIDLPLFGLIDLIAHPSFWRIPKKSPHPRCLRPLSESRQDAVASDEVAGQLSPEVVSFFCSGQ